MKKNTTAIIFCFINLLCCNALANTITLNQLMSESEALQCPYTLTQTIIPDSNKIVIDFKLNLVQFDDFAKVPGAKIALIPNAAFLCEPGKPQLSTFNQQFNIPSSQNCSITISDSNYIDFNIQLAPGELISCNGVITNNNLTITPYSGFFPSTCAEQTTIQYYRGKPIHHFSLNPILYDYENHITRVYTRFKVTITYQEDLGDLESNRNDIFKASRLQNLQGKCTVVESIDESGLPTYPKERTQDYLIVANKYTYKLEEFIEWKKTLGFRVHVLKNIPDNPAASKWTWQQMRDAIKSEYNRLDNLTYVLIWGSSDILPGIPFSEFTNNLSDTTLLSYTAYSLLDGNNDFTPEFSVGRICALDSNFNKQTIERIIKYEKTPITDPRFYSTAFLAGQFEPVSSANDTVLPTNCDYKTLTRETLGFIQWLERTKPILTANGITAKRIYRRHKILSDQSAYPQFWSNNSYFNITNTTDFPTPYDSIIPSTLQYPNFAWDGDSIMIKETLHNGCFLGMYYGHGNCNGWENFQQTYAKTIEASDCDSKSPLIFSISCSTGAHWINSFANYLSRTKYGPIAIIASVADSYILPNQYLLYGLTNSIFPDYAPTGVTSFFDKYNKSFRLGDILQRSQDFVTKYISTNRFSTLYQHSILTYNCFGDPSIDFNTDVPTNFIEPYIYLAGRDIRIDLMHDYPYPVYINFYEKETGRVESYVYDGPNYYFEATDSDSKVQISITSHNKTPYICDVNIADIDGESYFPRPHGEFINATLNDGSNTLTINFECNENIAGYKLRYVIFDMEGVYNDKTEDLELGSTSYSMTLPSGFRGDIQFYLINNDMLIDTYRLRIQL